MPPHGSLIIGILYTYLPILMSCGDYGLFSGLVARILGYLKQGGLGHEGIWLLGGYGMSFGENARVYRELTEVEKYIRGALRTRQALLAKD